MSWILTASAVKTEDVEKALRTCSEAQLEHQPFDSWDDDVQAQMDVAIAATGELATIVREDKLNLSVGGHARREVPGAAHPQVDSFSISVSGVGTLPPPAKK